MPSRIQKKGTIFLSPHSDDIVMSSSILISKRFFPEPYFLFTIFGNSEYVDISKSTKYSPKSITDIRINEDKLFSEELGMEFLWFRNPDCLLRKGYVIFEPTEIIEEIETNVIYEEVLAQIRNVNPEVIVVHQPYGPKQHYDHRIVKRIGEAASFDLNIQIMYVDDFPYSVTKIMSTQKLIKEINLSKEDVLYKKKLMSIYESQMCPPFYSFVETNCVERVFINI